MSSRPWRLRTSTPNTCTRFSNNSPCSSPTWGPTKWCTRHFWRRFQTTLCHSPIILCPTKIRHSFSPNTNMFRRMTDATASGIRPLFGSKYERLCARTRPDQHKWGSRGAGREKFVHEEQRRDCHCGQFGTNELAHKRHDQGARGTTSHLESARPFCRPSNRCRRCLREQVVESCCWRQRSENCTEPRIQRRSRPRISRAAN
jgi:hypothetical protein